ncbi:MAG: hypothetical protein KAH12_07600 [Anaerolineales bacterium]|nr:hypothetical protein [Anaerolineales bacterium]
MTFNPGYAALLGKELQMQRMREAEKERLIRKATAWNPSLSRKISVILRIRWQEFRTRRRKIRQYVPVSRVPKNSPSL